MAFDGDSGWIHVDKNTALCTKDSILQAIYHNDELKTLDKYVFLFDENYQDQPPFLIFEDMFHLLKCFRYRLC